MTKQQKTAEEKAKEKIEKELKEKQEKIKSLPVATINDLLSNKVAVRESGIKMTDGSEFKIRYRRLNTNEFNSLPKDSENFDERVEFFKHLILASCVEPKFESIEQVTDVLDIGLITDIGRHIDSFLFEERFL